MAATFVNRDYPGTLASALGEEECWGSARVTLGDPHFAAAVS